MLLWTLVASFVWTYAFTSLGYIPRSRTAGLYGNSVSPLLFVVQSLNSVWLCDPMDCRLLRPTPVSSVLEILQIRILEWLATPFSRGSSWPRGRTQVSCIAGGLFYCLSYQGGPRILEWVASPLWWDTHIVKMTVLKGAVQWHLVHPQCCIPSPLSSCRTFSSPQRETLSSLSSHSPHPAPHSLWQPLTHFMSLDLPILNIS